MEWAKERVSELENQNEKCFLKLTGRNRDKIQLEENLKAKKYGG